MAETENRTYRGNCHCGAFVYEAQIPTIETVFECNCSICVKKGYLWIFPGRENFNIVKGSEDALTAYSFGPKKLLHKFCPTCATPLMGTMEAEKPEMQLAINAHAIQGLNTWTLERSPYNGAALGEPYQPPAHKGDTPTMNIEGGKTYTGSCHCGALTVALVNKPLDETYKGTPDNIHKGAIECNCSICERNAYIWVYPKNGQVVLSGDEGNIGRYSFRSGLSHKTFCKICGVNMTNSFKKLSEEETAAMPEKARNAYKNYGHLHPVNARVLHGVDLAKLETMKCDGAAEILPLYVNP